MKRDPLRIGVTCYPTFGGSGVIATELGMALADRGHQVHFISYEVPRRLDRFRENLFFHEVEVREYPLFQYPHYSVSLASKMVEVVTYEKLDLLHVHYAVPHATSAYLARQVLESGAPKVITTLHGTDITLVGQDRSYLPITRFSIMQSDGVTAPSRHLKYATYDKLNVSTSVPIEVIPNFVDTEVFRPAEPGEEIDISQLVHSKCFPMQHRILTHVSNFRPVKRIQDVIKIFARVRAELPSHLILVGDGPERSPAEVLVREMGLGDSVCFLGKQESFEKILQVSDVFLLPSERESFGLAALEAMSCATPVISINAHGVPEVVIDGETGFLFPVGDVDSMAQAALRLLGDPELHRGMSAAARERAVTVFSKDKLVDHYEDYYYRILGSSSEDSAGIP